MLCIMIVCGALQVIPCGRLGGLAEVRSAAVVPHVRRRVLQWHHAYYSWLVPRYLHFSSYPL